MKGLARIKDPRTFDYLMRLLPQDTQMFPMGIPDALAILGDERAIPALIQFMGLNSDEEETNPHQANSDSDSDDELFFSIGSSMLK